MRISQASDAPRTMEELLPPALAARLDRLDVLSRKVFAGKMPGERRSKRRGQSVEFDDYREYTPGDDLRHIDWNVFARLDRFFVKLFREDEDLVVHLVLDDSPSMHGGAHSGPEGDAPTKATHARRLAMAIGYIGLVNQNRVVIERFGGARPRKLAPMRGRRQIERLTAFLLEPPEPVDRARRPEAFAEAMRRVVRSKSGTGVLVILSDFLFPEGVDAGLRYLGAAGQEGFDVSCMQVLAPGELDPALEADTGVRGDIRLTDIETGRASEVTISPALIERYRARLRAHIDGIAESCRARGMRHILLDTRVPVDRVILDSLRRRRIVG
jgi:uncharacterized protein (DUF58 family)